MSQTFTVYVGPYLKVPTTRICFDIDKIFTEEFRDVLFYTNKDNYPTPDFLYYAPNRDFGITREMLFSRWDYNSESTIPISLDNINLEKESFRFYTKDIVSRLDDYLIAPTIEWGILTYYM